MAASAQRISGTQRRLGFTAAENSTWTGKPPSVNKYGRDVDSPSERERARTSWRSNDPSEFSGKGDFAGWTALPHSWYADLARITRGKAQVLLLLYGWSQSYGRDRKPTEQPPEWTGDLKVKELANILRCTEKQVFDDLADGKERKVIDLRRPAAGVVRFRLRFSGWEALPDYQAPVKPAAADVAADEPALETDEAAFPKDPVVLLKRPAFVRAGQSSRPVQVTTGVRAFRLLNECNAGLGLDAVVIAGELQLTTRFKNARPIEINSLTARNGSTLPKPATGPRSGPISPPPSKRNGRGNGFSDIASKTGSALPKHGQNSAGQRLSELRAGFTDARRGLAYVDEDHAARVLREIGDTMPVPFFFQVLDPKILRARAKHEPYNPAWLIRAAKDAVSAWDVAKAGSHAGAAVEAAAESQREREQNIRNARRMFKDPDATQQDQDLAKEILIGYGVPLPEDV